MVVYTDQMFNRGTADTSLTQMAAGVSSTQNTYSPQLNGTLKRVDIFVTPQAATSLAQQGRVELSQTNWKPNTIRISVAGFGLATAPQVYGGNQADTDFLVDLAVAPDKPIDTLLFENDSPVTPRIRVEGTFTK